ncbi:phage holin family protein [Pseudomonas sp.]|uniref:phage holin family protein n=1 Tax=Pseudomonas sp. TaxID=306 RepID=UPI00258B43A8|nr:phage holin family protein [Pseudomonas sp.]
MNNDALNTPPGTTADSPTGEPHENPTIGALLRQLSREIPELFSKEVALAKAELQQSLTTLKAGVAAVAGGAIVLLAGLIILLLSVVYGLSTIMAPWAAALIVGLVTLIIGFIMLQAGKKQFGASHFTPDKTLHAVRQDKEALKRKIS